MRHPLAATAAGLAGLIPLGAALAQSPAGRAEYWHHGPGWGHMMFGGAMMILLWGGVIIAIVLAIRWLGHHGSGRESGAATERKRAIAILEERFARGEIDREEFEERKRLLSE